jgi:hypothetical protein
LILFLSSGEELSESVFHAIWEGGAGGSARARRRVGDGGPGPSGTSIQGKEPAPNDENDRIQVIVFDRRGFTEDPEEWCRTKGVEQQVELERELPGGYRGSFLW